jgi:hypothetical protein
MAVIDFLMSGGMATIGGDLLEDQRKEINGLIKQFSDIVFKLGRTLQVPASVLTIRQATYLFVGKDITNTHIIFAVTAGQNQLNYRDFTQNGIIPLQALVHQVRIEIGDVVWAFSIPKYSSEEEKMKILTQMSEQYVNSVLQAQYKKEGKPLEESINNPEIASGIEKFRHDYPRGQKIAFIIMQFGKTKVHEEIIKSIKEILLKYNIVALRADDKEYMDDLFQNVKVYLYSCDFGIAIYERILTNEFNPNVSLEVGYLLGMNKNVLLLKDKTLSTLNTDLTGRLYKEFDTDNVNETVKKSLEKWLSDKGYI